MIRPNTEYAGLAAPLARRSPNASCCADAALTSRIEYQSIGPVQGQLFQIVKYSWSQRAWVSSPTLASPRVGAPTSVAHTSFAPSPCMAMTAWTSRVWRNAFDETRVVGSSGNV